MKSELDLNVSFANGDYQDGVAVSEFEESEIATDFTSMCQTIHALYPENITSRHATSTLLLGIEGDDGSELMIYISESSLGAGNSGEEDRRHYVVFANANYYGLIDDTYKYKLSENGQAVVRLSNFGDNGPQNQDNNPIEKAELQKVRELLLLGKPRYNSI